MHAAAVRVGCRKGSFQIAAVRCVPGADGVARDRVSRLGGNLSRAEAAAEPGAGGRAPGGTVHWRRAGVEL